MSFVHLGLLLACVPLAITPIVLHLLTLHRLRTIELSTYRFLFDSFVRQRRRMQFEDLLLAVLRTLFMLLLIFALSRPIVSRWGALFGGTKSGRDVVLLIDASASMNMTTDGVSSMQRARQAAAAVVEHLPKEDRVTILRVATTPKQVCSRFSASSDAIQSSIDELHCGPSRANWFLALSDLFTDESEQLVNPRLYLISDMQAADWHELLAHPGQNVVPDDTEMFVIRVGSNRDPNNRGIISGTPMNAHLLANLPVILRPTIVNVSPDEPAEIPISLLVEDDEVDTQIVNIPPGESREAEFIYRPKQAGILRARYEIPADAFSADDTFRFAMTVTSQVSVLLINGHPSANALEDAALFLRSALTVAQDADEPATLTAGERQLAKTLRITESSRSRFDEDDLEQVDVVVLADCGWLSKRHSRLMRDYVAEGGGLIVLPGEHVDPDDYNRLLLQPANSQDALSEVRLQHAIDTRSPTTSPQRLGGVDFAHPVFSVFRNPDDEHLSGTRIHRWLSIKPHASARNTWTLMRLSDGSALMVESRFGRGRVLLSAIPFDTSWSNLPLQPEFVPLVLRMVSHVKRRPDAIAPPVVFPEGVAEIRVDQSWESVSGSVLIDGGEATPLEFEQTDSQFVAGFDGTDQGGFYNVEVTGGSESDSKSERLAFAVNTAAEESYGDALDHDVLDTVFPAANLREIDASAEAQQRHGTVGSNRELWRTLILLSLIVIAAEFLLATPRSTRRRPVTRRGSLTDALTSRFGELQSKPRARSTGRFQRPSIGRQARPIRPAQRPANPPNVKAARQR